MKDDTSNNDNVKGEIEGVGGRGEYVIQRGLGDNNIVVKIKCD